MRIQVLEGLKTKLEELEVFKQIYLKQTDWRTVPETPVAWLLIPEQDFGHNTITGSSRTSLRATMMIIIRLYCSIDPDEPESEIDKLIDSVIDIILEDNRIGGICRDSNVISVNTDNGILGTFAMGDVVIEVQI